MQINDLLDLFARSSCDDQDLLDTCGLVGRNYMSQYGGVSPGKQHFGPAHSL